MCLLISSQCRRRVLLPTLCKLAQLLAITAVIALGVFSGYAQKTNEAKPDVGSISGRVTSEGKGVGGATVFASALVPSSLPRTTTTDREGNFVFESLDRGLYNFSTFAPGFVTAPRDPETPASVYRLGDSAQINLLKGGVITGSVTDSSGEPMVLMRIRALMVRDMYGRPNAATFPQERFSDDRGVYRIYGLVPGTYLVAAGGSSAFGADSAYAGDAPTYAPSSTRDTAAQIVVTAGSEATGVDIRYRGEPGHAISGSVTGQDEKDIPAPFNLSLSNVIDGNASSFSWTYIPPGVKTFAFYGIDDGEYELTATGRSNNLSSISETKHIVVRGADVTGIELSIRPVATLSGRVALTKSDAPTCKDKREPQFIETLITLRGNKPNVTNPTAAFGAQAMVNKNGEFQFRSLRPGQYDFGTKFFAKYWFLKSIVKPNPVAAAARNGLPNPPLDLAKNGLNIKFSETISGVTVNLAEGAASLRGTLKAAPGERLPERLFVFLVPAEKESADDVLRFFAEQIDSDGSFAFNNVAPGRYFAITQIVAADEIQIERRLRLPAESTRRARVRREAEAGKSVVELKPCQNLTEYSLPFAATSRPQ